MMSLPKDLFGLVWSYLGLEDTYRLESIGYSQPQSALSLNLKKEKDVILKKILSETIQFHVNNDSLYHAFLSAGGNWNILFDHFILYQVNFNSMIWLIESSSSEGVSLDYRNFENYYDTQEILDRVSFLALVSMRDYLLSNPWAIVPKIVNRKDIYLLFNPDLDLGVFPQHLANTIIDLQKEEVLLEICSYLKQFVNNPKVLKMIYLTLPASYEVKFWDSIENPQSLLSEYIFHYPKFESHILSSLGSELSEKGDPKDYLSFLLKKSP